MNQSDLARIRIPADISQIHPNSVVHGYICNVIETGCFVCFLGRLTGFSPIKKATDDKKINLLEAYYKGQSVRCNVLDVRRCRCCESSSSEAENSSSLCKEMSRGKH
ncbi:hypothetical protein K1719_024057 [Acacia pycnantha]|nr:hypothetical protein K1719_024057 [Acacia pycnantha]